MQMRKKDKEKTKLQKWQERFETARSRYSETVANMHTETSYYEGSRKIFNKGVEARKNASNVRNICYELIETQVDSSIPLPKVTPIHKEDEQRAKIIEHILVNEMKMLKLHKINDLQERITPVNGASFFRVEWDRDKATHCTLGDLAVSNLAPDTVIPQPGIYDVEEMDYLFICQKRTKNAIKRMYGVDVSDAENTYTDDMDENESNINADVVTAITAYYRNDDGDMCLFTWCDDYVLEDIEDYQARKIEKCTKCGSPKPADSDVCPNCGCKTFKLQNDDYEEMVDAIEIEGRMELPETEEPVFDENGVPVVDEAGNVEVRKTKKKIPYYKPNVFPIIPRINVSKDKSFIGYSDVEAIKDQQDAVKKYGTKIDEKLLKGGSFVTLPQGLKVDTNGEDLNIVRLNNPAEKALIDVLNIQPNVGYDQTALSYNYEWARSTLGITDAYQGKHDASARSGSAKQYSINQAAGRLESKRIMKNEAWAKLYEVMFKFLLAYADQTIDISSDGVDGNTEFGHFDRYDFLKIDAAGEFYWGDEFIFEVDPTSSIMANREAMWNANDFKLQSGAFGQVGDLQTARLYWTLQAKHNYPNAGEILKMIDARIANEQGQLEALQEAQAKAQEGVQDNAMPLM